MAIYVQSMLYQQLQLNLTYPVRMDSISDLFFTATLQLTPFQFIFSMVLVSVVSYEIGKNNILFQKNTHQNEGDLMAVSIIPQRKEPLPLQVHQNVTSHSMDQNKNNKQLASQQASQNIQKITENSFPSEMLKQKVELELKKVQSTSYFQTRLQPSRNTKYMRKIQKHQIVTDYEIQSAKQESNIMVPFKSSAISALSQPHSLLEVVAHQDYNSKLPSPWFEKKFISLGKLKDEWRHQLVPSWILQNGRFDKSFRQIKMIGKGGFGKVYQAVNLLEDKKYAIKKLVMKGLVRLGEVLNEVLIISKFHHPNIVNYYSCWIQLATIDDATLISSSLPAMDIVESSSIKVQKQMAYIQSNSGFTFQKSSKKSKTKSMKKLQNKENPLVPFQTISLVQIYTLHIQMELCEGSLHTYLHQRKEVNFAQSFAIFEQIVHGLNFLHSNGVVHRDLKPANILLCNQGKQIKIGDFGLATLTEDPNKVFCKEKVGTPLYMAPQIINNSGKNQRGKLDLADVYSIGVIYYELLHMLNTGTQHERSQKLLSLQMNKVQMNSKQLRQEKKMIKVLTKTVNRPNIHSVLLSKQFEQLRKKYPKQ